MRGFLSILWVFVSASAWAAPQVYQDNVVILLDGSGSMSGRMNGQSKMRAATSAIATVVRSTPQDTQIGLLVFTANRNPSQGWVFPLGPRDDEQLIKSLRQVKPSGGTPLGRYIQIGAERLLEQRQKQLGYGSYRLLVVTDGAASDRALMNRIAPQVLSRGLRMDVIGVDMQEDHLLARNAHSYRRANDAEALEQAIADVLAEVSQQDGRGQEADFALLAGLPDAWAMSAVQSLAQPNNQKLKPNARPYTVPTARQASATTLQHRPAHPGSQQVTIRHQKRGNPIAGIVRTIALAPIFVIAAVMVGSIIGLILKNR